MPLTPIQVSDEIKSAVVFNPGEEVYFSYFGSWVRFHGPLLITNQRILWFIGGLQEVGFITKKWAPAPIRFEKEIYLDEIVEIRNGATITMNADIGFKMIGIKYRSSEYGFDLARILPYDLMNRTLGSEDKGMEFKKNLELVIQESLTDRTNVTITHVHVNLDFADFKEEMAKGGFIMQTIKCPSCGANISIPETGQSFTCSYCNTQVQAIDLFDRMKKLISELK